MPVETVIALTVLIFLAAILYSSVGHAGASAYLAVMALFGLAPAVMKPTALCLNVLVATIATVQFARAGCFSWGVFWPFAVGSIPAAYLGGALTLPGEYYRPVVGVVLLFAASRLLFAKPRTGPDDVKPPRRAIGLLAGAAIGLLSGLTGTGGGIFLSPLMLAMHWGSARDTAGVSAAFVLVNSVAGLLGLLAVTPRLPEAIPWWAVAAGLGGWLGSHYGSRRLQTPALRRLLAAVLIVAGLKLILS